MEFKAGDLVRVKDMYVEEAYGGLICTYAIASLRNRIFKISSVGKQYGIITYQLEDTVETLSGEMLEPVDFSKKDLRTGYIATLRDGYEYVVYLDIDLRFDSGGVLVNYKKKTWLQLKDYSLDLFYSTNNRNFDIMKVEKCHHPYAMQDLDYSKNRRVVLWERDESYLDTEEETVDKDERVYISKSEYEELLEYKYMYEDLM